nr:serine beta-lactamase-like protein LACTB, mitochondrial [Procambarus clarkii]XP_045581254.1 serine beta-lactamase-like protein LACTB, mitochondrial [Procambarus clarkii]XP_045581255.1 serine beta-lactamase-like protein LACTB, mitochondrial [Procambarus clarkii]XP_045581256.1 serine beta-lactamase-like protein LACTB, mitochondrial [Procambarus clarkii]XP_045581258.1 serine beta-lactamase-like protein LACTB, mitochondrial [Procambarus clarkii]XP_045581259.1 serine beta-lactamase-like protein 
MFHTICKSNIVQYGRHYQQAKVLRTAGSHILGSCHIHQEYSFKTSTENFIHKLDNAHINNSESKYERGKYHRHRVNYRNQLGILAGIMGTAAILGIDSALCENQEENAHDEIISLKSTVTSTISNISSGESLTNQDADQKGQDVVGTEKHSAETQAFPHGNITYARNTETASTLATHDISQKENLTDFQETVKKSRQLLKRCMEEAGTPGIVVAVSVNGKTVWADGFGFADLENNVRCTSNTVMRIASISKALTMTAVARLWEEGKLDLDAPIQKYIPSFPVKTYHGEEVTITTRHLISHKSGIRNYKRKDANKKERGEVKEEMTTVSKEDSKKHKEKQSNKANEKNEKSINSEKESSEKKSINDKQNENEESGIIAKEKPKGRNKKFKGKCGKTKKSKKQEEEDEFAMQEYYIKEEFNTVQESLELFQNDELYFKPGTDYLYTTHGWTVVSAVVEGASGKPFTEVITRLFYDLGLENTYLDKNAPIIYNRARYYIRDKDGKLKNAPYIDNSYKWAGGGFLSTVHDLCKFGNVMLYSSQQESENDNEGTHVLPGFLKASTMQALWTPVDGTNVKWVHDQGYGMGWEAMKENHSYGFCRNSRHFALHSGAAVGASSVLLVLPKQGYCCKENGAPPKGVVVSIITNMQSVNLKKVALQIAHYFENLQ